jgi:type II secretory pathway pseudopilin PulG
MNKNLNKKNNRRSGFTLMETLVAIFIVMLAITGPMVFTQNALRAAFLSRDQITAFFLAQDAIEYIKNIRDGHVVDIIKSSSDSPDGWLGETPTGPGNLIDLCLGVGNGDKGCSVDTRLDETEIISCASDNNIGCVTDGSDITKYKPLNYVETSNDSYFTNQNEGVPSLFAREIKMKEIEPGREVEISVTIRWKSHEGVGTREIVVKENIFNWANALLSQSNP